MRIDYSIGWVFVKCNLFSHARESHWIASFSVNSSQNQKPRKHSDFRVNGPDGTAAQSFTPLAQTKMWP